MYQPPQQDIDKALDWLLSDEGRAVAEIGSDLDFDSQIDLCVRLEVGRGALIEAIVEYERMARP